jgi:FKBP-type peptidyl-prolyl cis-trans isomerase (trigger factor)
MSQGYTFKSNSQKDGSVIYTINIESAKFVEAKEKSYNKLAPKVSVTGFRPGKAPRAVIEARLGNSLYDETINNLLPQVTEDILKSENANPISRVEYKIIKFSDNEGLEYEAQFVNSPEIKLGDMSKIKVTIEKKEVTDNDIEEELKKILEIYNRNKKEEEQVKELTEEIIKELKLGFSSLDKLKEQIKLQLSYQYESLYNEQKLKNIIDKAIEISKIEASEYMVSKEIAKIEHDYKHRIEDIGISVEEFLKGQNTTLEDMRVNWKKEAEARIKTELLFYAVVQQEKLSVNMEEVEKEVDSIKDDKLRKEYSTPSGKQYTASVILQQKAIKWITDQVK